MKKRTHLALAFLAVVATSACGGGSQGGQTEGFVPLLDTNTECKITVVGDYKNFQPLLDEFTLFNKYYKNVKLSYSKEDDYENTIATILDRDNDRPNIFFSKASWVGNRKYDPVFAHAENLSDPALKLDLDCVRPGLINRDASGNVCMIPVLSRTYGVLVNKNLFAKENIEMPTSWFGLLDVCEQFRAKEYKSPMMGYSQTSSTCLMNTLAYPDFVVTLAKNPSALALANNLDPAAGVYMRGALEKVKYLVDHHAVDLSECDKITDFYAEVIFRFLDGDVPMMICPADTVSGVKSRESKRPAFVESPFEYEFHPIPLDAQGGYFIDSPSVQFSVNTACDNLAMTNEFMRFLITKQELIRLATSKGLVPSTKEMPLGSVYLPFTKIPAERTFSPEALGVKDPLATQIREASFKVGRGEMTVDEAIANYGSFA